MLKYRKVFRDLALIFPDCLVAWKGSLLVHQVSYCSNAVEL